MATLERGIVTPEAVVLEFDTAGIASRALARAIDFSIQGALLVGVILVAGIVLSGQGWLALSAALVGTAAVVLGYPVFCEVVSGGRSPGKAALGLRVVTVEGAPISARHAFIRSALGLVDFLLVPGGLIAVLVALFSVRSQRLGDVFAGTMVLRERTATRSSGAVWFSPPADFEAYAASLDVSAITDAQFGIVRSYLLRRSELSPEARQSLSVRLCTPLVVAMHHHAPPGVDADHFLQCAAAAYQRRHASAPPPPPPSSSSSSSTTTTASSTTTTASSTTGCSSMTGGSHPDARDWHYLDHAASTPMRPAAIAAMVPVLREAYGNPSGAHALAREARALLEVARERLAAIVGSRPGEIVFTSGGTEADNLAVRGVLGIRGGRAVCLASDHHAVLHVVEQLGGRVARVDARGIVDLDALAGVLGPDVSLVSVAVVNNEIGSIQPLDQIAEVVQRHAPGALLHADAAQALCWLDLGERARAADLITLASHKCGGPRGIGALVVRAGVVIEPQQIGGGQERDRRSGTQDVASAVAFAVAAEEAAAERGTLSARSAAWRELLVDAIVAELPGAVETAASDGERSHLVPGIINVCLPAVDSEALLYLLEHDHRVIASAASSCASGAQGPSHVLAALGIDRSLAGGSLRLSLGWSTTDEDVAAAARAVPAVTARLQLHARDGSPA